MLIVPFGYLSVLISILCMNGEVRSMVSSQLPGKTLKLLLDTVEEFLLFHKQIDCGSQTDNGDGDLDIGFIRRLQVVVNDLKS